MKLWYTMFILTFIILYGTLSVAILGSWVVEKSRALWRSHRAPSRRFRGSVVAESWGRREERRGWER